MSQSEYTLKDIDVFGQSIFNILVCVPKEMPREEVVRLTNTVYPCGTTNGWMISKREMPEGSPPNPCPCADKPDRLHYVMDC